MEMGKPERIQVDRGMDNVAQCKDVRRFAQDSCLARPHRTRNDEQRFRDLCSPLQSCHAFPARAMEQKLRGPVTSDNLPLSLRKRKLSAWR